MIETNVAGNSARRKQTAIRKVLRGEMEELCCSGMVEGCCRYGIIEMTSEGRGGRFSRVRGVSHESIA